MKQIPLLHSYAAHCRERLHGGFFVQLCLGKVTRRGANKYGPRVLREQLRHNIGAVIHSDVLFPSSSRHQSKPLIIITRNILHDILNAAIQDDAQVVDGGCIKRLVLTELVDRGAGNVVILDERIGGLGGLL